MGTILFQRRNILASATLLEASLQIINLLLGRGPSHGSIILYRTIKPVCVSDSDCDDPVDSGGTLWMLGPRSKLRVFPCRHGGESFVIIFSRIDLVRSEQFLCVILVGVRE